MARLTYGDLPKVIEMTEEEKARVLERIEHTIDTTLSEKYVSYQPMPPGSRHD